MPENDEERMREMIPAVCGWYRINRRDLPWRHGRNAYHTWVSEIMLQQTRVETVIPYYERFLRALPAVQDLAVCPEERLLKLWEGLGYYSRVRNMQKAARQIMDQYGGKIPEHADELEKLCGVGSYTAGAIASIAFGEPVPAVDGNALRIMSRVFAYAEDISKQSSKRRMEALVAEGMRQVRTEKAVPEDCGSAQGRENGSPGDFNQGLMDLGSGVCLPGTEPHCEECPVSGLCLAHRAHRETDFPVKAVKKPRRVEDRTVMVICEEDRVLLHKRPDHGLLAGLYEFPNETGRMTEPQAVNFTERLGLEPIHIEELPPARHIFTHIEWRMTGFKIQVSPIRLETETGGENAFVWAGRKELLQKYALPGAFRAFSDALFKEQRKST